MSFTLLTSLQNWNLQHMWLLPSKQVETNILAHGERYLLNVGINSLCSGWWVILYLFLAQTWSRTMGCVCPKAFLTDKGNVWSELFQHGWIFVAGTGICQLPSISWEAVDTQHGRCNARIAWEVLGRLWCYMLLNGQLWVGRNQRGLLRNLCLRNNKSGMKHL